MNQTNFITVRSLEDGTFHTLPIVYNSPFTPVKVGTNPTHQYTKIHPAPTVPDNIFAAAPEIELISVEDGVMRKLPVVYSSPLIPVTAATNHTPQYKKILPAHIVNVPEKVVGPEPEIEFITPNPRQDRREALYSSPAHNPLDPLNKIISMDHNYCLRNEQQLQLEYEPILLTFNENKDSNSIPKVFTSAVKSGKRGRRPKWTKEMAEEALRIKLKYNVNGRTVKHCKVPFCKNNSRDNPDFRFFYLSTMPFNREMFNIRLELAYKRIKIECRHARGYVCQEHYYLEEDVIDLDSIPWKLKDDVLPRKLLRQEQNGKVVWCDYDMNVPPDLIETAWKTMGVVTAKTIKAVQAENKAKKPTRSEIVETEDEEESESDGVNDERASDSWSDEEIDKTLMSLIATKAVATGKTVRTRRDGPVEDIEFFPPPPSIPCKYCSKMFKSDPGLLNHIKSCHKDVNIEKCKKCSREYFDMQAYLTHDCVVHIPQELDPYEMIIEARKISEMKRQERRFKKRAYPFSCVPCNQDFSTGHLLNNHITNSKLHSDIMDLLDGTEESYSPVQEDLPDATEKSDSPVQEDLPDATEKSDSPAQEDLPDATEKSDSPVQEDLPDATEKSDSPAQEDLPDATEKSDSPAQEDLPDATEKSDSPVQEELPDGTEKSDSPVQEELHKEPAGIHCPKCPESFESDDHLIVHLVNHGLTYKCDVCSETITEWSNIYQHMQTHLSPSFQDADLTHNCNANTSPSTIS